MSLSKGERDIGRKRKGSNEQREIETNGKQKLLFETWKTALKMGTNEPSLSPTNKWFSDQYSYYNPPSPQSLLPPLPLRHSKGPVRTVWSELLTSRVLPLPPPPRWPPWLPHLPLLHLLPWPAQMDLISRYLSLGWERQLRSDLPSPNRYTKIKLLLFPLNPPPFSVSSLLFLIAPRCLFPIFLVFLQNHPPHFLSPTLSYPISLGQ